MVCEIKLLGGFEIRAIFNLFMSLKSVNGVFHLERAVISIEKVFTTPHNMTPAYQNQVPDLTLAVIFKVK